MIKIFGLVISEKIVYSILTLAIGYLIYRLLIYIINKSIMLRIRINKHDTRRLKTTNSIINNIVKYTFGGILIFTILGILGVNASAIVASIGVVGLAIGLAIQDTLKDVLAGIFILVENQFAIGDIVMIGTFKGEVIFLGLKTTKLRSETGEVKILSNRNILEIINYSLDRPKLYLDIDLAYDNDEKVVENIIKNITLKDHENTKVEISYLGIQKIGDKVTYRLSIEADAKHQESIKSEILSEIKELIDSGEVRR